MIEHVPVANAEVVRTSIFERIEAASEHGDGKLDILEFTSLFEEEQEKLELSLRAQINFEELDVNETGYLVVNQIGMVVDWMLDLEKTPTADKELLKSLMMKRIDTNKDDKLSFNEYNCLYLEEMHIVQILRRGKHKFDQLDIERTGELVEASLIVVADYMLKTKKTSFVRKEALKVALLALLHDRLSTSAPTMRMDSFISLFHEVLSLHPEVLIELAGYTLLMADFIENALK